VALCGEKGLVSGFPNTIAFALLCDLCVLCGEDDLGFRASQKKIFVFSVALCDLCGEKVFGFIFIHDQEQNIEELQ